MTYEHVLLATSVLAATGTVVVAIAYRIFHKRWPALKPVVIWVLAFITAIVLFGLITQVTVGLDSEIQPVYLPCDGCF